MVLFRSVKEQRQNIKLLYSGPLKEYIKTITYDQESTRSKQG